MAARTEVIYPSGGVVLFDGGLDTKFEKIILPDNESHDCLNVVFKNGAVIDQIVGSMPKDRLKEKLASFLV